MDDFFKAAGMTMQGHGFFLGDRVRITGTEKVGLVCHINAQSIVIALDTGGRADILPSYVDFES